MRAQYSYNLHYAMLLQEYQKHGTTYNDIDPSVVALCQSYHENNKEVCL